MDSTTSVLSAAMVIKLVQIYLITPLCFAFIIFNRLSRTQHWAWDIFWSVYALNRIILFYLSKGENVLFWLFLNAVMLALEGFALIMLSKSYARYPERIKKIYAYVPFFTIFPLTLLGYFTPETMPGYELLGIFYGQYLALLILGAIMIFFGVTLIRKFRGFMRSGIVIGLIITLSGISTAFSLAGKFIPLLFSVQLVLNIFLVIALFIAYILFRIEDEIRKRSELEILYNNIANNISNVALVRLTESGQEVFCSPLAIKLFSRVNDFDDIEKKLEKPEKFRECITKALNTGEICHLRTRVKQKEFLIYIYPGKYQTKRIVDIAFLDVTELLDIEKQLREENNKFKKRLDEQLEFFSNIVHELKSPLTIIKGYAEMLESSATVDQKRMLLSIHQAVEYQLDLINNLLEVSKLQAKKSKLNIEKIDLSELIADVAYQFADISTRKGVKLEIEERDLPHEFYTDPIKLKRVLVNLLDNAFKFTTTGKVRLSIYPHNEGVYFEVKDTGIGIKKEFLAGIFDRFTKVEEPVNYNLNPSGTGLGLFLTKELVELLGGKIKINSEYGMGTTVSFTISNKKRES
ncbi:sensor histidine kinase [Kosmotoga pacifica]|uniref:histidine kinase n=1 Tax=Kosmotoga pacifica TaxID=1330330 RepID=A0A0G2ZCF4_9BACT|nr:HAMP domain-containing sensor histidine kinase [Kosmotoga pacifica]AKI97229.1 hypothetical protein IX53_04705 [Kosmotoga pacifica]